MDWLVLIVDGGLWWLAWPEQEKEKINDQQDALINQELLNCLELRNGSLSLKDHEEEDSYAHLREEVFAELARAECSVTISVLHGLLLE